ncbi:MAG TPA: GntR family transcriptional regulator, partial [Thermotogaceae bacterium]|nr:GntR family transcriptional regulator [Thermotogaceae bacterium]
MNRSKKAAFFAVNSLKKMIVFENLDKLPGEITLSKKLGVSRVVVREAIRILEYEG